MTGVSRRALLAGLLLAPPALAACSTGAAKPSGPDPLIALADAARADAALAGALIAATPALADQVKPLKDARTLHATALDAEIARLDPARASVAPAPATAPATAPTLDALRTALTASAQGAAALVLTVPTARVGLVASVTACCATYAGVLVKVP